MSEIKRISDLPELTWEDILDTDILVVRSDGEDFKVSFLDLKTAIADIVEAG